ncbi:MAG: hypothetical protein GXP32_05805 [Kiritimatiellaeota bacterium]|nr:hypothetical protein [Kiritimatiellota bacterium]
MSKKRYLIRKTEAASDLSVAWDSDCWTKADTLVVDNFLPDSSDHRPGVEFKMLYDEAGLYGMFNVKDKYVRCVAEGYQSNVCKDSCVEFFVTPVSGRGYFNFEFNCGGEVLTSYVRDNSRAEGCFADFEPLADSDMDKVEIFHTLPGKIDPEIAAATEWRLAFHIPYEILSEYCGEVEHSSGTEWEANFYKCGDATSHPHWASWNPIHKKDFHLPEDFGIIAFE